MDDAGHHCRVEHGREEREERSEARAENGGGVAMEVRWGPPHPRPDLTFPGLPDPTLPEPRTTRTLPGPTHPETPAIKGSRQQEKRKS
ncbi:hypothetical protein NDU88_011788 [Pleurodeles waltl]|uniref:Uncharacterized protein n=1 Tax=Pleurodeles waltl TaxID=8319 RepID=A0AAV7S7B8_PLEWA|nr:hypothetical protein NDU88_011788 [Pleurodeles waltl]